MMSDEVMRPSVAVFAAFALASAGVAGCSPAQSALASVQEVAQQMNLDAQFGRTEIAMEIGRAHV